MATDTSKVRAKLAALSSSFDDLEALLEPLFAETLPETLVDLEPLQQAKLQTVLPYIIYDLIFIFLKARGIDPKTHPVVPELDRIRQYFEKISNAENPSAKRAEVDKAAAGRFIKHAIAQAQWKKTAAEEMQEENPSGSGPSTPLVPARITQKMQERAEYEKAIKQEDAEDSPDDVLEVFDDADNTAKMEVDVDPLFVSKRKGKEIASATDDAPSIRTKRRRVIDVFTGLSEEPISSAIVKEENPSSKPPSTTAQPTEGSRSSSLTPATGAENSKSSSKKIKKKKEKK